MNLLARLLAASLFVGLAASASAHMPAFREWYLSGGNEQAVLVIPNPDFSSELWSIFAREGLVDSSRVWGERDQWRLSAGHWSKTLATDVQDLKNALTKQGLPDEKIEELTTEYQKLRSSSSDGDRYFSRSYEDSAIRGKAWVSGNERGRVFQTDFGPLEPLLNQLPQEFALYFKGAVRYRADDLEAAVSHWTELLALPKEKRTYRSVWAAYMLGKAYMRIEPAKAIPYFEQARQLAAEGMIDSAQLATDSLGVQAMVELDLGNPETALRHYLDQTRSKPDSGPDFGSIRRACEAIGNRSEFDPSLIADPLARRVLLAWSVSKGANAGWIASVEKANLKVDAEEAGRLAWADYRSGKMDSARRWIDAGGRDTPTGQWVLSKLQLRDGKIDDAMATLEGLRTAFPETLTWRNSNGWSDGKLLDDSAEWAGGDMGDFLISPRDKVSAELGVLLLGRRRYVDALDAFIRTDYWEDAVYVAERVLTVEEVENYLASHSETKHTKDIHYILARRLARMREWDRALPHYPANMNSTFTEFVADLREGRNPSIPLRVRAGSLYKAGNIARHSGMELMGTEMGPDFTIEGGDFSRADAVDWRAAGKIGGAVSGSLPEALKETFSASAEEKARVQASRITPDRRFHYRYYAAEIMWECAELLPDNDPLTANALIKGGLYCLRDEGMSDRFYQALVKRCPKLEVGQKADEARQFPYTQSPTNDTYGEFLLAAVPSAAEASPTTTTLYVNIKTGDDRNDGLSWTTPKRTIRAALIEGAGREVWVAEGVYHEAITIPAGAQLYGGFALSGKPPKDRKSRPGKTILDGGAPRDASAPEHMVRIENADRVHLDGFVITGGWARGTDSIPHGGGIYLKNAGSECVIEGCTVTSNLAAARGAGIYADGSPVHFVHDNFLANIASDSGGGIYLNESAALLEDCNFIYNTASYGSGGGASFDQSSGPVARCNFVGNLATTGQGGGASFEQSSNPINACTFAGNWASLTGGALHVAENSSPIVVNSIMSGNRAGMYGGAMFLRDAKDSITQNCTIAGNVALMHGGAVGVREGFFKLSNCILAGNGGEQTYLTPNSACDIIFANCLFGLRTAPGEPTRPTETPRGKDNAVGEPFFVMEGSRAVKGKWTSKPAYDPQKGRTTFQNDDAEWKGGVLAGRVIRLGPDLKAVGLIASNTKTRIEVLGDASALAKSGDHYAVLDYHIENGSAAFGRAAVDGTPAQDMEANPRPGRDARVDIGAYEASGQTTIAKDNSPPRSLVHPLPATTSEKKFNLAFQASDIQTGIKSVDLYFRRDGGEWTRFGDKSTSETFAFDATPFGEGTYDFRTSAVDLAGNREPRHSAPDASTIVMTRFEGDRVYVSTTGKNGAGRTWDQAFNRIGDALIAAASLKVRELWVAEGKYVESIVLPSGISLIGGFQAGDKDKSKRNFRKHVTILDGSKAAGGNPARHVILMRGVDHVLVDGFTITGGRASISAERKDDGFGGGLLMTDSFDTNRIANCTFEDNNADTGGGMALIASSPTVEHVKFARNSAKDEGGAAVIKGSLEREWNALAPSPKVHPSLLDCEFSSNKSLRGGAVHGDFVSLLLDRCKFMKNTAGAGGALDLMDPMEATFKGCQFLENEADGPGGAVHSLGKVHLKLSNSLFFRNLAHAGGSAITFSLSGGSLARSIVNCTFAENRVARDARIPYAMGEGAIQFSYGSGGIIDNCIFAKNDDTAILTGSLANGAPIRIGHSLFFKNGHGDFAARNSSNILGSIETMEFINAENLGWRLQESQGNLSGDPLFVNPDAGDLHLRPNSPCIDAGRDTSSEDLGGVKDDLDGVSRPQPGEKSNYDIGAYEFHSAPVKRRSM